MDSRIQTPFQLPKLDEEYYSIDRKFTKPDPELADENATSPDDDKSSTSSSELCDLNLPITVLLAPKKLRQPFSRPRKALDWLQYIINKLINILRHYASWVGFLQTIASSLLQNLPAAILRFTDFISPVSRIISGLKLLNNTTFHLQGRWTRALCLLAGVGSVGLGLAAILVPAFGLFFAIANIASNTFLSLWNVALAVKNKYWGKWKAERTLREKDEAEFYEKLCDANLFKKFAEYKKLVALKNKPLESLKNTQEYESFAEKYQASLQDEAILQLSDLEQRIRVRTNQERRLNADLALKIYNTGIILLALVGIVMVLFPPTIILGASILLATSIHGAIFGYDLSGKWPHKVQDHFFGDRPSDPIEEIEKQVEAYKTKKEALPSTTASINLALRTAAPTPEDKSPLRVENSPSRTNSEKLTAKPSLPSRNTSSLWRCSKRDQQRKNSQASDSIEIYTDIMP